MKPVIWIGSTRAGLSAFPEEVKDTIGYALYWRSRVENTQTRNRCTDSGGAGILEIVENHVGDTYRAVYTVRLASGVYVLHVFQKKSKTGIKTPKSEIDLIKSRLKRAEEEHRRREW